MEKKSVKQLKHEIRLEKIKQREQNKPSFSKLIIGMIILMNIVFTMKVLGIFQSVGNEPTTLIVAWFAFTTGELWLLATIKKKEIEEGEECDDE